MQPALLARGLRRVALERGVRIFERSPMTRLERSRPPRVHTPGGIVTAERVVLAMNAWLAQIGELSRSLFVLASDMVATAPMPERLAEIGLNDGVAISDSRLLVNYYRTTLDGRIAFGQGGGLIATGRQDRRGTSTAPRRRTRAEEVASELPRALPDAGRTFRRRVRGPARSTARTTGLPLFGRLGGRPDIVFGAGYSGNGVGPCYPRRPHALLRSRSGSTTSGRIRLSCFTPRGGFPPEPIRYLGAHVVRAAVARKERREDRRKTAGAADVVRRRARAGRARSCQEEDVASASLAGREDVEAGSHRPVPACSSSSPSS